MAYDLAAIRKAKQTYKATPATPSTTPNRFTTPIQAMTAATSVTGNKAFNPTATSAAQTMVQNTQPRTEQTLNNLQSTINKGFNYDRNTDDALQSAIRNAQQTVQDTQRNTNAGLRANGQGKSSYSETVAQNIGLKGAAEIENNLVPQYVTQAYQRYQDGIANEGTLYNMQYQQDVSTPLAESQQTGVYQNAAVKAALATIADNKTKAEAPGVTAAQRMVYSQEANKARAILDQNGVDSSKFGANVNSKDINFGTAGVRTIAGQTLDMNKQESQFNQGITITQLTGVMPDGKTKTTAEQQRVLTNLWTAADRTGTIPDELADMYGIARGTQTIDAKQFAQQLAISQQNANTSRNSANNSADNSNFSQLMDVWQATGQAPAGLENFGVSQGQEYTAKTAAAVKAEAPKTYENYQNEISKVVSNNSKNPTVAQDYIKSLPISTYEKYRAWVASGYEWPAGVPVPTAGE